MDKLTKKQEEIICELLHCAHNKEITQFILRTIGEENWTRGMLSNCMSSFLTEEQNKLSRSLGGGYSINEMAKMGVETMINCKIADKLKEQGVTHFLYKNDEYLDAVRVGDIICEGINIKEIKNMVVE